MSLAFMVGVGCLVGFATVVLITAAMVVCCGLFDGSDAGNDYIHGLPINEFDGESFAS